MWTIIVLIGVVFALVSIALGVRWGTRSLREDLAETTKERDEARGQFVELEAQSRADLEESKKVCASAVEEAAEWKHRADRNFKAVERMEVERNEWKEMYYRAGREMARAQEMLLSELERVSRQAHVEVKPHLRDMVQGYRKEHVTEAPQADEKMQQKLGPKPPEPVSVESPPCPGD